jgi:hypothetical protein
MSLKAGTNSDFSDSMAEAIETALKQEWPNVMGAGQSVESNPQLRLLCIAVAQGVIRYLNDNSTDSLWVHLATSSENDYEGHIHIETTGTLY